MKCFCSANIHAAGKKREREGKKIEKEEERKEGREGGSEGGGGNSCPGHLNVPETRTSIF